LDGDRKGIAEMNDHTAIIDLARKKCKGSLLTFIYESVEDLYAAPHDYSKLNYGEWCGAKDKAEADSMKFHGRIVPGESDTSGSLGESSTAQGFFMGEFDDSAIDFDAERFYCDGNESAFRLRKRNGNTGKVVKYYYDMAHSSAVTAKEIREYGAVIMREIDAIESTGARVELWSVMCSSEAGRLNGLSVSTLRLVCVKRSEEPYNAAVVSATLEPCYLRVHGFAWWHGIPKYSPEYGYGYPVKLVERGVMPEEQAA
jgi:hypothetical protein